MYIVSEIYMPNRQSRFCIVNTVTSTVNHHTYASEVAALIGIYSNHTLNAAAIDAFCAAVLQPIAVLDRDGQAQFPEPWNSRLREALRQDEVAEMHPRSMLGPRQFDRPEDCTYSTISDMAVGTISAVLRKNFMDVFGDWATEWVESLLDKAKGLSYEN